MEKNPQDSPAADERRLSYCELNVNDPGNPRLGAGHLVDILSLPDDGANIRFIMLEPLDGSPWRARWSKGNLDEETGRITIEPWEHPSQFHGAWAGFFLPLIPRISHIARRILEHALLEDPSGAAPLWVRVQTTGLAMARCPVPPTPASLLEDSPEPECSPIYVRLIGEQKVLGRLVGDVGRDFDVQTSSTCSDLPPMLGPAATS